MRTYLSPIGFNTTSVTRTLITHGIGAEDVVILVRPENGTDDGRATEAVGDIEQLLHEIEPTIEVNVRRVSHNDFENAVLRCSELIKNADGSVVVSLSGGARDVLLPLTVAAIAHEREVDSTLGYSDIDGQVRDWTLPNLSAQPTDGQMETLAAINSEGPDVSIPKLTEQLEKAKSTITRHVNELASNDLVVTQLSDRTKHVSITLAGHLSLRKSEQKRGSGH